MKVFPQITRRVCNCESFPPQTICIIRYVCLSHKFCTMDNVVRNLFIYFILFYYHFTALYNMHYYEITIISLSVLSQC